VHFPEIICGEVIQRSNRPQESRRSHRMEAEGSCLAMWSEIFALGISLTKCGRRVGRTAKENQSYDKEIVSQTEKIEKMRADGKDFHDIKQQVEHPIQCFLLFPEQNLIS